MFSKCLKLSTLLIFLAFLNACGNSEDAEKIKSIIEINELNVTALQISSPNTILEIGANEQFSASGIVDGGNKPAIDASTKVRWSSSDSTLASIDQNGKMTSLADGLVTITAHWADLTASKDIMLSSAALNSINIIDSISPVSVCTSEHQLTAQGLYDDATTRDITDIVSWSSADTGKLTIDQTGQFTSLGSGVVNITATRNTISDTKGITINDDLESISISAPDDEVSVNSTLAFTATGTYSNPSTTQNLTTIATWQSDDATKLSISNTTGSKGVARGIAEGSANISATCNSSSQVSSGQTLITVTPEVVISGVSINQDASSLEFKIADSPERLVANFKRSDGTFSTDITDDDDTTWSITDKIRGDNLSLSNTKGSKGEISFTEIGLFEIRVIYSDPDSNLGILEDRILVEIVE